MRLGHDAGTASGTGYPGRRAIEMPFIAAPQGSDDVVDVLPDDVPVSG
jgi:hypothetical protein